MKSINVGIVGAGRAGMIHARTFARHVDHVRLVGIADPSEPARLAAHAALGIDVFAEAAALMEHCDALVIVTPTSLHCDLVVEAVSAGCHVLCEKPMAMNVGQCQEMIDAATRASRHLQIGFMRRFDPGFRRAKEIVDSGAIGDVVIVKSLTHGPSTPQPWMYDLNQSNGPLAEVSSHDLDAIRWYSGADYCNLYATAGNYRCLEALDEFPDFYDTVLLNTRLTNGCIGLVDGAQGVKYGYDSRVEILGTHGRVDVGDLNANRVVVHQRDGHGRRDTVDSWRSLFTDAYIAQDQSFINSILADDTPEVTGEDGLAVVAAVVAGNESIRTGNVITVERAQQ